MHLAPLLTCLLAGLALSFAPVVAWHLGTGRWVCINHSDLEYYLQIAAQAYYNHPWYISDPSVPGGATLYPWFQFIPAVYPASALGFGPLSVALIWDLWAAVGMSAGIYFVFWRFLGTPWGAAGCTIFALSDAGLSSAHLVVHHVEELLKLVVAGANFGRVAAVLPILWQWRILNPALDLPFIFLLILTISLANERPSRLNVWLSGLAFGLLFYVYFYAWTMAAAGLSIAFLLDSKGRKIYWRAFCIGFLIGLPQLSHEFLVVKSASAGALLRFGLFAHYPRLAEQRIPRFALPLLLAEGAWIWKTGRRTFIFLWSLPAGAMLLRYSRLVTGLYLHEYHWQWVSGPVMSTLLIIMMVSIIRERSPWRAAATWACTASLALYLLSGICLAVAGVTRVPEGLEQLETYRRYEAQRLVAGVARLAPGSVVAGREDFCDLAVITEGQHALVGKFLDLSRAVDDRELQLRSALNAYLEGSDRAEFERKTRAKIDVPESKRAALSRLMRDYDFIAEAPDRFIEFRGVRYVALPANQASPAYLKTGGWTNLQPGPYWQVWERRETAR